MGLIQCSLYAQNDSIDLIETIGPEVSIEGVLSASTILMTKSSDNSVSDPLSQHIGIQIQTQGGPYLRTALYRGQSARHMAILWEGVNIQNSFNGTYDLGLIPSILFSNSKWFDGGQSANVGTAAMSGALMLAYDNSQPLISAGMKYSDQGNRRINFRVHQKSGKLFQTLQANLLDNENAFRYQSRDTIAKRRNSDHNQLDLTYRASVQWSDSMRTNVNYWYQDLERMLSPSTIASNLAYQKDRNHRFSIGHDWQWSPKLYWSTKLAYMNEYIGYMQPGIESLAESNIVNFNSKLKINGHVDHLIGVAIRYENGELVDTINPSFKSFFPERITSAVYYNGTVKIDKTTISLSLRQESVDDDVQIPIGQLALKFDQFDRLSYTLNVGRHYSYPGFNDLYWPAGGNPDLITEKSWQIEGGISIYGLIVKVYKINTSDKILWAPNEQAVWTPENVSSTESSGFEIKYNGKLNIRKNIGVTLTPMVNYNHTINSTEGVNKGNELLYNPKFKFRLRGVFQYKQISLSIDRSYTGRRFQTLDNKDKLDPYNLLSAELNYKWNKDQKYSAEIYLGARNIFEETFELVSFFPQPLRTIYIGVIFSI